MSARAPAGPSALEAEGWTRRFTAIGPRLNEAIELYRALGYELRLEPAAVGEVDTVGAQDESCAQCMVMTLARTIYTRRPVAAGAGSVETGDRGAQKG